ncbi:MAG TPA: ComF family protein [Burkholderiaceae bacterium]|nr:ComF family protein [Burkholderiaceae bacterium]
MTGMAGQYIEAMPPNAPPAAWFLPGQCAVCRGWAAARVCGDCRQRFAFTVARCRRCAIDVPEGVTVCGACLREPPPFDAAIAAVDYAFPWDALVRRLKFGAELDLAPALAELVSAALRASNTNPQVDCVVPMPLSEARLRERGFNQAWEVARRIARAFGWPADAGLLLRPRDTAHQVTLAHDKRIANVRGAFAVEPSRHADVAGRDIALVDDVLTTGATAAEAATVLKRSGARSVQVWVVARTPLPRDADAT